MRERSGLIPARAGSTGRERQRRRRAKGSSPRERGARRRAPDRAGAGRLIPARAGSTIGSPWPTSTTPAHPRASGEHVPGSSGEPPQPGSSPRERGAQPGVSEAVREPGLIPARAGSTAVVASGVLDGQAHPRASGEHDDFHYIDRAAQGSSPRERGALARVDGDGRGDGLIPARAGSTDVAQSGILGGEAHPRASGEHSASASRPTISSGSSPRERGAPRPRARCAGRHGLIPARAGSTSSGPGLRGPSRAHPRASGEHPPRASHSAGPSGSSPRERGAQVEHRAREAVERLIPARAGSTPDLGRRPRPWAAHPRASGEHTGALSLSREAQGSSPRERGARSRRTSTWRWCRLIPARAGSTCMGAPWVMGWEAHPRASGEHHLVARPHGRDQWLIPARAGSTRAGARRRRAARAHPRASGEHPPVL